MVRYGKHVVNRVFCNLQNIGQFLHIIQMLSFYYLIESSDLLIYGQRLLIVLPFRCSDFIQETYKYNKNKGSYIAGAVYDVSMVLSPGMGFIIVSCQLFLSIYLFFLIFCCIFLKKNDVCVSTWALSLVCLSISFAFIEGAC